MSLTRAVVRPGLVKIVRPLLVGNLCARSYASRTLTPDLLSTSKQNKIWSHAVHPDFPDYHVRPSDHKNWVRLIDPDRHVVGVLDSDAKTATALTQPGQKPTTRHAHNPSLALLPQSKTLPETSWLNNKPSKTSRIIHPPPAMRAVDIPSLAFNAVGVSNHGIQQMPVAEFATVMKSLVTILLKSMPLDKEKRYQAAVDILFSSMGCKTAWELGAKNIHGKGNNKTRADLGISGEPNTLDATVEVKCAITTRGSGETQFRAAFAQNSAATHLLHYQHVIQPRLKDFIRTLSRPVRPDTPAEVLAGQAKFLLRESLNGQTVDMFIVIGYYITGFRVLATSILDDLHLGDHGMPFLSILPYTLDPKGWLHILDDADTIHIRLLAAGVKGVLPLSLEWLHTLERAALRGGLDGFQKCLAERDLGRIY